MFWKECGPGAAHVWGPQQSREGGSVLGRTDRCQNGRGSTFLPLSGEVKPGLRLAALRRCLQLREVGRDPLPLRRLWHGEG